MTPDNLFLQACHRWKGRLFEDLELQQWTVPEDTEEGLVFFFFLFSQILAGENELALNRRLQVGIYLFISLFVTSGVTETQQPLF